MAVLPTAMAGAIFQLNKYRGRFHGEISPAMPRGCRSVKLNATLSVMCASDSVCKIAVGDLRIRFACCRFDVVEVFPADWLNEFAADEITDSDLRFGHSKLHPGIYRDSSRPSHKATAWQATSLGMTRKPGGSTNLPLMKFLIRADS